MGTTVLNGNLNGTGQLRLMLENAACRAFGGQPLVVACADVEGVSDGALACAPVCVALGAAGTTGVTIVEVVADADATRTFGWAVRMRRHRVVAKAQCWVDRDGSVPVLRVGYAPMSASFVLSASVVEQVEQLLFA